MESAYPTPISKLFLVEDSSQLEHPGRELIDWDDINKFNWQSKKWGIEAKYGSEGKPLSSIIFNYFIGAWTVAHFRNQSTVPALSQGIIKQ